MGSTAALVVACIGLVISAFSFAWSAMTWYLNRQRSILDNELNLWRFYLDKIAESMPNISSYERWCRQPAVAALNVGDPPYYWVYRNFGAHLVDGPARVMEVSKDMQKLSGFWMSTIAYVEAGQIPKTFFDFQSQVWLQRAWNYMNLVEPLEIANYYRNNFHVRSGHYLAHKNRPLQFVKIEEKLRGIGELAGENPSTELARQEMAAIV
jgi:hypothetical protein